MSDRLTEAPERVKLTRPQGLLLIDADDERGVSCHDGYAPARRLVELGFAVRRNERLYITDAGRRALQELDQ